MDIRLPFNASCKINCANEAIEELKRRVPTPANNTAAFSLQKISAAKNLFKHEIKKDPLHGHPNKCNGEKVMQQNGDQ